MAPMTEASDDGTSLPGYSSTGVALTGRIEYRYGSEVPGSLPIGIVGAAERFETAGPMSPCAG